MTDITDDRIQALVDAAEKASDAVVTGDDWAAEADPSTILALIARLRAAEQRGRDLGAVLRKYGQHLSRCPSDEGCWCGWANAFRALLPSPEAAPEPGELTEEGGVFSR